MPQLTNENNAQSVFGTVPHDLHRFRRDALSPFFSKASVAKLDPLIQSKVRQLCSQMEKHAGSGKPVSISMAFSCMTTDVVTEFAFTRTYNFLDSESFEPNFHKAIAAATEMGPVVKHFPWMLTLLLAIPELVSLHHVLLPQCRGAGSFAKVTKLAHGTLESGHGVSFALSTGTPSSSDSWHSRDLLSLS